MEMVTSPPTSGANPPEGGALAGRWLAGRLAVLTSATVAVTALTATAMAAGFARLAPCLAGGWRRSQTLPTVCYSDLSEIYLHRHAAFPALPYLSYRFEYPVLTGAFAYGAAAIAAGLHALGVPTGGADLYFAVSAVLLAACGIAAALCTARLPGARPADGVLVGVGLSLMAYLNWDLLAVLLTAAGLLAFARSRPLVAGALLGLGTAAKLYPVLVLGAVALALLRAGRPRTAGKAIVAGAGAWAAVNLPFLLTPLRHGWTYFYRFSAGRPADLGTVWDLVAHALPGRAVAGGLSVTTGHWVDLAEAVTLAAALAAVAALARFARRPPTVGQLAFLSVAAFLLTSKSWSPQYTLWLLPLAVGARLPGRAVAAWLATEVAFYVGVFWFLNGDVHGRGPAIGLSAILVLTAGRLVALAGLAVLTVRKVLVADELATPSARAAAARAWDLRTAYGPAGNAEIMAKRAGRGGRQQPDQAGG